MAVSQQQLAEMLGRMKSPTEKRKSFRGMLYGPSGSGKTVEAVRIMQRILPEGKGALHVDIGEGFVSIANHPELDNVVKSVPFQSLDDLAEWYNALSSGQMPFIGGLILDEGSAMAEIDVDRMHSMREDGLRGDRKATGSLVPEWSDYNATLARFRALLADFMALEEFHVIFIAHETETKNKDTGKVTSVHPNLSPKIRENVKRMMHLVARLSATSGPSRTEPGKVEYVRESQVQPIGLFDAKTRINSFGQVKFGTEYLAGWIGDWLDQGGEEVEPVEAVPESDPVPSGMTTAEALEVADTSSATEDVDEDFTPISVDD